MRNFLLVSLMASCHERAGDNCCPNLKMAYRPLDGWLNRATTFVDSHTLILISSPPANGSVEMLLVGNEAAVNRMIERCREGPMSAQVNRIDVEPTTEEAPAGFETRPTG